MSNNTEHESLALESIPRLSMDASASLSEIEQPALPPTDGGKAAWLMLASCCLIQVPVWGVP